MLTSRVNADVVVSTPTTYKLPDFRRSFPFSVRNRAPEERYYRLEIADADKGVATFAEAADVDAGVVTIFPYSSVSQVVYVNVGTTGTIRVDVTQVDGENLDSQPVDQGQTGTVTFVLDQDLEQVANLPPNGEGIPPEDVQDPFVLNPFVLNPFVLNYNEENPFVLNSSQTNFSASNPFVLNPFVLNTALYEPDGTPIHEVYDVVDTSWDVQTDNPTNAALTTNTASTYIPLINIDNAEAYKDNYAFELLVYKTSYSTGYRQAEDENGKVVDEYGNPVCEAYSIPHDQILSNVVQDPGAETPFVLNPFVLNPFVLNSSAENPFVLNPFVLNPFVLNSAFTMAPPEGTSTIKSGLNKSDVLDDGTIKAPRASNDVKMLLRAFRLKPFCADVGANVDSTSILIPT